ncbi:DUF1572 domain-containing protein [Thermaerobacter sp. FW80]|uniref:DUF1572 family protein n=1 Tax=Thermaerobacter sp. FW80 TaxID=2546351 RepID=UPI0010750C18|nr:DUF1572 family protein [Thermaerobacter sp. FW80]QBS36543.1 DUF1572 domain-containing protein [Thermaerobacter sp. FW80]QBS38351.1 DUF1572 domain-containing protein [Thermaerobacter sp. FW80]
MHDLVDGPGVAEVYLEAVKSRFRYIKDLAERALAQVDDDALAWSPGGESNSITVLIKHLSGNMVSRWTDFLTSDGEKPDRDRDAEFVEERLPRQELMERWERGWRALFATLDALRPDDLLRTVFIRGEPHTVIDAIERQLFHTSYHVGQIVYLAKARAGERWQSLTIPRRR